MYGKIFASMYEGSMVGAGCHVFALWGYIISRTVAGRVEVNPKFAAFVLGCTEKDIERALAYLCAPDPNSRNKDHDGRRLVQEGQFQYFVPSHAAYRRIMSEEERREYNRIKQQEYRARKKQAKMA